MLIFFKIVTVLYILIVFANGIWIASAADEWYEYIIYFFGGVAIAVAYLTAFSILCVLLFGAGKFLIS